MARLLITDAVRNISRYRLHGRFNKSAVRTSMVAGPVFFKIYYVDRALDTVGRDLLLGRETFE